MMKIKKYLLISHKEYFKIANKDQFSQEFKIKIY